MRIFLIGFMGSGKTTLGSKLASKLNYEFIDLDKMLEATAGMTIADFFKEHGEEKFREYERDLLQTAHFPNNTVVSTGGGAPCYFDNMDWMNQNGTTIYLSLPSKVLAQRLKNGKQERPLIKDLSEDQLTDFIQSKLEERSSFYEKAQYIINGIDITPEKVIKILQA